MPVEAKDSGFSLLEILVVMAITAMVATVLTATTLRPRAQDDGWRIGFSRFLREARMTALREARPVLVRLEGKSGEMGGKRFSWADPPAFYLANGTNTDAADLLIDADGWVLSAPLVISRAGQSRDVSELLQAAEGP